MNGAKNKKYKNKILEFQHHQDTDLFGLCGFGSNGALDFRTSLTEDEEENASNVTLSTSLELELDIGDGASGFLSGTIFYPQLAEKVHWKQVQ